MGHTVICDRLVKARELLGYNRKVFAEMLDIPYRTITNYENGSREPGSDYIVKVADKCGVTTDWLLGLSDNPGDGSLRSNAQSPSEDSEFDILRRNYEALNAEGRSKLIDYSDDLVQSKKYKKFLSDGVLQEA